MTEDGNIYGTGSNASGQLGLGLDVVEIQTPKQITCDDLQGEKIIKIGCGESHTVVVTGIKNLTCCLQFINSKYSSPSKKKFSKFLRHFSVKDFGEQFSPEFLLHPLKVLTKKCRRKIASGEI